MNSRENPRAGSTPARDQITAFGGRSEPGPDSRPTASSEGESLVISDGSSAASAPHPKIPGYEIIEVIGSGGMGVVYKARHQRLNRIVALKVILSSHLSPDADTIKRFQREAQAAAQLLHPNVVLVFDSDQCGDTYFIAMEYVDGIDLHQLVKDHGPLPIERACDYIRQAALGLQHAFEQGLVHRDIKPSNLLVARASPSPAGPGGAAPEVVKILDMGLALVRQMPDAPSEQWTQSGALMGTPDFIAPEQALDSHAVDIRSDLYSLGCSFYYLLAGKAPFGEFPMMQKLMKHQTVAPPAIEEVRPEVPTRLGAVVRKLMAKRPEDRYQTPAELIDAFTARETPPKKAATPQSSPTAPARELPSRPPIAPGPKLADSTIFRAALPLTPTTEVALPSGVTHAKKFATLEGHRGWVTSLAFAPDRTTLVSGGVDGDIRFWTLSSSKGEDRTLPGAHASDVTALAVASKRRLLASGSGSLAGHLAVWDWSDKTSCAVATVALRSTTIDSLAFSPNDQYLASAGSDKLVRVWDVSGTSLSSALVLKGHTEVVRTLAFATDNRTLASGGQDGTLRLWNVEGLWSKARAVLEGSWGPIRTAAFSTDGKTLAFGCLDQSIRLWDVSSSKPKSLGVLKGHGGTVRLVHFNPDAKTLLSICDGWRIILWDLATGDKLREWLLPHAKVFNSISVTQDGRYVATGDSAGCSLLFRLYPR